MSKLSNPSQRPDGTAHIPGKKYRYPGVQPFSTEQSELFKGRNDDTERFVSLILQEKLCVLFGKSGYGKSSLLNAGIIPALQAESDKGHRHFLPVSIRFYAAAGKDDNLFKKFQFHTGSMLSKKWPGRNLESPALELPDTLWGGFKRRQIPPDTTIVLLFDQFEEFFSYPEEQQLEFKKQLAELIYAEFPSFIDENETALTAADTAFLEAKMDVRAVFSIRKDRLADLDRLKDKLPAILHKRIELLPLSRQQARAALVEPAELDGDFESVKFTWSAAATSRILDALSQDKSGQEIGVEAFQLQILAEYIENRIIRNEIPDLDADGLPDVRPDDLPSDLRNVYGEYYRRKINELPENRRAVAREIIEEDLVSGEKEEDARRLSMDGVRLLSRPGADAALLNELVDTFLLRREANTIGGYNYELSHDTLLKPVLDWRDERRAENERIEVERKAREDEARAAEERRFSESERLKNEAIKAKKKAERNLRYAAGLAIIAFTAMGFAWLQFNEAKIQAKLAITEKLTSDSLRLEADSLRVIAERNSKLANDNLGLANTNAGLAQNNYKLAMQNLEKAQLEERKTQAALLEVKKEKDATEAQRKVAEINYELAKKNAQEADEQRQKALEALSSFVRLTLKEADDQIYHLNYDSAWAKIRSAAHLGVEQNAVVDAILEIIYFYTYTKQLDKAGLALGLAITLSNNKTIKPEEVKEAKGYLSAIQKLNAERLIYLDNRYFPEMVAIPEGQDSLYADDSKFKDPPIPVSVSAFKIARTETTVWQYNLYYISKSKGKKILENSIWTKGNYPIVDVSWDEAYDYTTWLSESEFSKQEYSKSQKTDKKYDLPLESQWQFAARGETYSKFSGRDTLDFSGSDTLDVVGWFEGNASKRTHPVAIKKPNGFGLYDMSGNVSEWCYAEKKDKQGGNIPGGWRGGDWDAEKEACRITKPAKLTQYRRTDIRRKTIGFRVVISQ